MKVNFKINPDALKALEKLKSSSVKVGWFESAVYQNGVPVAMVASAQEFGVPSKGVPPRPFFRPTIAQKKESWLTQFSKAGDAILSGKIEPAAAMGRLGMMVQGDVKRTISRITAPALSDKTIIARIRRTAAYKRAGAKARSARVSDVISNKKDAPVQGVYKPLVDTGLMLTSLSYEVQA